MADFNAHLIQLILRDYKSIAHICAATLWTKYIPYTRLACLDFVLGKQSTKFDSSRAW